MYKGFNLKKDNNMSFTLMENINKPFGYIPLEFVKEYNQVYDDYDTMTLEIPNKILIKETGKIEDVYIYDLFYGKHQQIIVEQKEYKERFIVEGCKEECSFYQLGNKKIKYKIKKISCYSYEYTLSNKSFPFEDDMVAQLYHGVLINDNNSIYLGKQDDADGFMDLIPYFTEWKIKKIDDNARKELVENKTIYTKDLFNNYSRECIKKEDVLFDKDVVIENKKAAIDLNINYLKFCRSDSNNIYDTVFLENKLNKFYLGIKHIKAIYSSSQKYENCIKYQVTLSDGNIVERECECPYMTNLNIKVEDIKISYTNGDRSKEYVLKYRTLEKGQYSYIALLRDFIEKAFNCIVIFDTYNLEISVYSQENVGIDTGIEFSYDTYLSKINKNYIYDTIINKLNVSSDKASIINENPLGTDYILDFSYQIEHNLISKELQSAWNMYTKIINDKQSDLQNLRTEKEDLNNQQVQLETHLEEIKYQLENYNIELYRIINDNTNDKFKEEIEKINNKIQSKKEEQADVTAKLEQILKQNEDLNLKIKNIVNAIDMRKAKDENGELVFSKDLLNELDSIIIEDNLEDSFYDTDSGLYDYCINYLHEKNKLDIECEIEQTDLLQNMQIPEGLSYDYYIKKGNFVNIIDLINDDSIEKARIIEIKIEPCNNKLNSIRISTKDKKYDDLNNVESISRSVSRSNTYINAYKPQWEMSEETANRLVELEKHLAITGDTVSIGMNNINSNFDTIISRIAAIDTIFAGNITSDMIQAGAIIADKIAANSITVEKLASEVLEASNIKFESASGNVMDLKTLLSQFGLFDNEHVLHITGENAFFDNAIIKDAMIDSVSANKLLSGELNTAKVSVHGKDGKLSIIDNTLQVIDDNKIVRLQLGLDNSDDYSYNIFDKDGKLQWSSKGVTENGIEDHIIRDLHIADDAEISGFKIDVNSLMKHVNDNCTETLDSSLIKLISKDQSLDVAFNSLTQEIEGLKENGINMLLNSQLTVDTNWEVENCSKEIIRDADNHCNYLKIINDNNIGVISYTPRNLFTNNKYYTFSAYVYGTAGSSIRLGTKLKYKEYTFDTEGWQRINFTFYVRGITENTPILQNNYIVLTENGFNILEETSDIYEENQLVEDDDTISVQFINPGIYKFERPQLEKGTIVNTYSLSPNDTITQISENKSEIKIEKDRMDELLKKTSIIKDNGVTIGIEDSYNETVKKVDENTEVIAKNTSQIDKNINNIISVTNIANSTKDTLDKYEKALSENNVTFEDNVKNTKINSLEIQAMKDSYQLKITENIVKELMQGTNKVKVVNAYAEYYFSTASDETVDGYWSKTYKEWQDAKYIWGKIRLNYDNNSYNYTKPILLTNATGKLIKNITLEFYLSTSNIEQQNGEWSETCPEWEENKYLWNRFKIEYDTTTVYSDIIYNPYWLPTQMLQTSDGNILLNTTLSKTDENWVVNDCIKNLTKLKISNLTINSKANGTITYDPSGVITSNGDYVFSVYITGQEGNVIGLGIKNNNSKDNLNNNILKTFTIKDKNTNRYVLRFHVKNDNEIVEEDSKYYFNNDLNYNFDEDYDIVPVINLKDNLTVFVQFITEYSNYKFERPQLEFGIVEREYKPSTKDLIDQLYTHDVQINANKEGLSTLTSQTNESFENTNKSISELTQKSDELSGSIKTTKESLDDINSVVVNNSASIKLLQDNMSVKIDSEKAEKIYNDKISEYDETLITYKNDTEATKESLNNLIEKTKVTKENGTIASIEDTYNELYRDTLGLTSKVSSIQNGFNNLQIGTRNLLRNSGDLTKWIKESYVTCEKQSNGYFKIDSTYENDSRYGIYQNVDVLANTDYTLSVWCYGKGKTSLPSISVKGDWGNPFGELSEVPHMNKVTVNTGSSTTIRVYFPVCTPTNSGNYAFYYHPKLEKGTIATDYTEAPEDIENEFSKTMSNAVVEYYVSNSNSSLDGGSWSSDSPKWTSGKYIWSRTKTILKDGSIVTSSPVCIQGAAGQNGKDGVNGQNGTSSYTHIRYSANSNGNPLSTTPSTYIGIYVDNNSADSSDYTKYKWNRLIGQNGTPGAAGKDGKTPYLHIKYSNDGGKTFTSNSGETVGTYIGTYTDYTSADSTSVSSYTWAKIKGDQGIQGAAGQNGKDGVGIKSIKAQYYCSTNSTSLVGGSWSYTCPVWSVNHYLWTRTEIYYTNSSTPYYTEPFVDSAWEMVNNVAGRISTAESSINQLKDQIDFKVTRTDVDTMMTNLIGYHYTGDNILWSALFNDNSNYYSIYREKSFDPISKVSVNTAQKINNLNSLKITVSPAYTTNTVGVTFSKINITDKNKYGLLSARVYPDCSSGCKISIGINLYNNNGVKDQSISYSYDYYVGNIPNGYKGKVIYNEQWNLITCPIGKILNQISDTYAEMFIYAESASSIFYISQPMFELKDNINEAPKDWSLGIKDQYIVDERIKTVEEKITDSAIISTVTNSSVYQDNLSGKVDTSVYKSEIDQLADEISAKVSKDDIGTEIEQNAEHVRIAWNNISKYVQFEYAELNIYDSADSNQKLRMSLNDSGVSYYRDGYKVGNIGTNYYKNDNSLKGLEFDLEYNGAFMTWSHQDNSSDNYYTMKWTYANKTTGNYTAGTLNASCDIDMHNYTLKNVNFEKGGITGTMNFVQVINVGSNGTLNKWSNNCKLQFYNGILISGTWSS